MSTTHMGGEAVPQAHVLERAARVLSGDRRAAETVRELVTLQWEHARALARERLAARPDHDARAEVADLERAMSELERTLHERPWTEV